MKRLGRTSKIFMAEKCNTLQIYDLLRKNHVCVPITQNKQLRRTKLGREFRDEKVTKLYNVQTKH